jgi:hypothetical protein
MEWLGLLLIAVLLGVMWIMWILIQITKQLDTLIRLSGGLTPDDVKHKANPRAGSGTGQGSK